jgi:hypothetical protein
MRLSKGPRRHDRLQSGMMRTTNKTEEISQGKLQTNKSQDLHTALLKLVW